MSAQREEPVSPELEAIARKYWDDGMDMHTYTTWGAMLTAVKEAHALGLTAQQEGTALVPLTPTAAMLDAIVDAFRESTCFDDRPFETALDAARDAYSRMLAQRP